MRRFIILALMVSSPIFRNAIVEQETSRITLDPPDEIVQGRNEAARFSAQTGQLRQAGLGEISKARRSDLPRDFSSIVG
ncbi:hypothetical protein GGQ68_001747 [Sagittula marina]|uniref:Uncharacterized protein n=1 Tax=Sagittula marina TaxID=943940 RepID=A0A7W6DLY1_9RHOB|nr:hypothetical protein [Sagittula marina]MBB3985418.1 hypothetical protein [Sagittula marina]